MLDGLDHCCLNNHRCNHRLYNRKAIMKPAHQTKFGYPDGNCHAAALASVLEIPLKEIPDFGVDDDWYDRFARYMISRHALQPLDFILPDDGVHDLWIPQGYHLINGTSERGLLHSVVGFMGEVEFDPHPDNTGLKTVDSYTIFAVLDPATSGGMRERETER